jgi:hypothetical protein
MLFSIYMSQSLMAGEAGIKNDGSVTWQAGVDGVEIDWKPDGSVRRISSRYSTPVEFADRRGVYKAQTIAEEKAKASIIRFLKQSSASTRIVAEVQTDINKATQNRETGEKTTVKKSDERVLIESLTEITASFAAGTLRGVIVLEKGYDEKTQEAWVVVGISDKTLNASRGVNNMLEGKKTDSKNSTTGESGIEKQPSEVRRHQNPNW